MNGTLLTVLETDPPEVRFQKELLKQIIANELTEAQQGTFLAYYVRGLSMADIAKERGTHRSTVQRTLVRAEKKIYRFTKYLKLIPMKSTLKK